MADPINPEPNRPYIRYNWERQQGEYRVNWVLVGGNGQAMVGSLHQGFRDKTDARRSVTDVIKALAGDLIELEKGVPVHLLEQGPGPKPDEAA